MPSEHMTTDGYKDKPHKCERKEEYVSQKSRVFHKSGSLTQIKLSF